MTTISESVNEPPWTCKINLRLSIWPGLTPSDASGCVCRRIMKRKKKKGGRLKDLDTKIQRLSYRFGNHGLGHGWITILCSSINWTIFIRSLRNLQMNIKKGKQRDCQQRTDLRERDLACRLTLKTNASSLNLRFSVGTKPAKKILIPSLTLKGMVTTP